MLPRPQPVPTGRQFDDQGVAGSDDDEDDEQPDRDWDRPTTKEELHQLRERHGNNRRTATYFYKQRRIQMEARIIYIGARLVAKEFGDTVQLLQTGQGISSQIVMFS